MFCLERDNTTYQSSPDLQGITYRASFELYPFYEGKDYAVYKGLLNGNGPKRGCFCAVKARLDRKSIKEDWDDVLEISHVAKSVASRFNAYVRQNVIRFTEPLLAQMDSVSDFNGIMNCFKPHQKKIAKEECVILEEFVSDEFQYFSTNPKHEADVTRAFSHFSWHDTRDMLIGGLKGASVDDSFHLTTPVIHSLSRRYGPNDCHWDGIVEFFKAHQCNHICIGWHIPDLTRYPIMKSPVSDFNPATYLMQPPSAPPPYS